MNKMYSPEKAKQMTTGKVKPTGKVVGRENLSPQAQAAIARLEAKKGLPPDMQYTRNGKKISAEQFNRVKSGNIMPGGGKPGGFLGGMMEGAKNMLGGMFKPSGETETIFRDGNKISYEQATPEQRRYIDEHNAGMAKIEKKYGVKLSEQQPSPAAPPAPPVGGGSNVKVVRMPSPNKEKSVDKQSTGGSDVDAVRTGNGNKAKWNILGIPMPF